MADLEVSTLQTFNFERFIHGGEIIKWNNNYGHVNFKETYDAVQAFSHWTWHITKKQLLVSDVQGLWDGSRKSYTLFDPAIHATATKAVLRFGSTNLGEAGIHQFFLTHKCNDICRHLRLERHSAQPAAWCARAGQLQS